MYVCASVQKHATKISSARSFVFCASDGLSVSSSNSVNPSTEFINGNTLNCLLYLNLGCFLYHPSALYPGYGLIISLAGSYVDPESLVNAVKSSLQKFGTWLSFSA